MILIKQLNFLKIIIPVLIFVSLSNDIYASKLTSGSREIDWFWFFYEKRTESNSESVVYRPFFMEAVSEGEMFQASLMPLIYWRFKNESRDTVKGFFGFYQSDSFSHKREGDDYDSGFSPLFLYGDGDLEKDRYLFVYPFGGNIKGKFGHDRISPWIFPGIALFFIYPPSGVFTFQTGLLSLAALIPLYTEFEMKDYSGKAILWPLIKWGEGDKRYDFRILPFYAHNYKEGWYDTYSWLLLLNYREIYFKNDTRYTFFFFPFYGRKWSDSGDISAHTILWPFFSWGYDEKRKDRSYNLPWPFIQIRDCEKPEVRSRIFFPFYGRHNAGNNEAFFVTPLYFRLKKETDALKSAYHFSFFLFWYFKRDYTRTHEYYGNSWRYFKIWPLLQTEWNDSGMYSINILSLLPFRDTMGYERLYQPFWTLFEYRRKADGEKHLGILLRTYYQVWSDDYFKMKVPFIVSYESRGELLKEFTVLFSSFGYERDEEGAYIRFFWLPVRIGEGETSLASAGAVQERDNLSLMEEDPLKFYGFNPSHGDLFDRSLDGKFFVRANLF